MKKLLITVVSLLLCHLTLSNSNAMSPDFYYLKVTSVNCEVKCFLNGMPVYNLNSEDEITNQTPVNLYLVRKDNKLDIWMKPLNGEGRVEASIYAYQKSDIVSTDDEQPGDVYVVVSTGPAKEASFTFSNEKFDFSHSLVAPPVATESEARAYAAKLLEIIDRGDAKAYVEEMKHSIADYLIAFSGSQQVTPDALERQFSGLLSHPGIKKVKPEEIECIPRNQGKLWELRQKPDRPFIYIPEKDGSIQLEVFVAKINGEFKIIR